MFDIVFTAPDAIAPNGGGVVFDPTDVQREVLAMCTAGTWRPTSIGPTAMCVLADPATLALAFPEAVHVGIWRFDDGELPPGDTRERIEWDRALYLEAQPLLLTYSDPEAPPTLEPSPTPIQASTWPGQRPRDLAD